MKKITIIKKVLIQQEKNKMIELSKVQKEYIFIVKYF